MLYQYAMININMIPAIAAGVNKNVHYFELHWVQLTTSNLIHKMCSL